MFKKLTLKYELLHYMSYVNYMSYVGYMSIL